MEQIERYLKKDLDGRINDRIHGNSIAHHVTVEFQKKLHKITIGQEVSLAGYLLAMRGGGFLEFPPGSGIGINVFGEGIIDYVDGMCLIKGVVRPRMVGNNVIGKEIQVTKIEEDYYPAYDLDIAPLTPHETFSLFRERINAPEHILKALFLSPISSPVVLDKMGGVSSIFDFPSRIGQNKQKTRNMYEITDVVLQMIHPWHRNLNSPGFTLSEISRVDSKLGNLLRDRKSSKREMSVIYPRTSYDRVTEFYEASVMENTIVLHDIEAVNAPDFERYLNEIRWSIMINHSRLRRIENTDLPKGYNTIIDDWFKQLREKDQIYEEHVRLQGLLDNNFQGRRGIILRVMSALARFDVSPPTKSHLKESLKLQEELLEVFIDEHGETIDEYERSKHLQTVLKPIKKIRNLIFDICQSEGGINLTRIKQEAQKLNAKLEDAYQVLYDLLQEGYLYQPTNDDFYKLTP